MLPLLPALLLQLEGKGRFTVHASASYVSPLSMALLRPSAASKEPAYPMMMQVLGLIPCINNTHAMLHALIITSLLAGLPSE